jgi:hypothetical protein
VQNEAGEGEEEPSLDTGVDRGAEPTLAGLVLEYVNEPLDLVAAGVLAEYRLGGRAAAVGDLLVGDVRA